jgi:hypothetical protein
MMKPMACHTRAARRIALWLAAASLPLAAQVPASNFDLFERKIRPVLVERCVSCHGAKARISYAGLQLDSKQRAFRGSDAGPVLVPGKPAESRLYQALLYTGAAKMPPTGKLPADVIDAFQTWIAAGAPWPEDAAPDAPKTTAAPTAKGADHWAWKPVAKVAPPAVSNTAWVRDPIDQFLLAKLEAHKLQPAPEASREVWLRRVTFDLTGLPPTIDEQQQFLNDRSPQAHEKAVTRLLASPAFGERWGRHWLDQTYYADNIEIGRRVPARHAWRYRDYVIDAFNRDVPYNRFLVEQLAGDQLEDTDLAQRRRNLIATGFLALGPWPLVNADKEQLRMDVVDMQVDLVGRTMLGVTTGCARCHDHKFDPITLRDYYGMAGIFASTRTLYGRLGLSVFSNVNTTALPEFPEELTTRAAEVRAYEDKLAELRRKLQQLREKRKPLEKDSDAAKALDKEITAADNDVKLNEFLPPVPATAHAVQDAETPADCRINLRGNAHQLGDATPRSGIAIAMGGKPLDIADFTSGRKELADWITRPDNPLTARVMVNRVWHHLFGAGIVASIDNFGLRGGVPSHPELLDHLATAFLADGWSVKKLVRRMVLSSAYRQSAEPNEAALAVDAENRLLWRMSRRRLEAETIRDAMLAVSGRLDPKAGGPALPFFVPGNMSLGKPESLKEEAKLDEPGRFRRSVYLPVLRKNQLNELDILNLFNFPDVNQVTGARAATTIPTQALYLMNAPFVQEQAAALARRVKTAEDHDEARIGLLLRLVYGRAPQAGEVARYLDYVKGFANAEQAWQRLCHSLLISNEFLYRS